MGRHAQRIRRTTFAAGFVLLAAASHGQSAAGVAPGDPARVARELLSALQGGEVEKSVVLLREGSRAFATRNPARVVQLLGGATAPEISSWRRVVRREWAVLTPPVGRQALPILLHYEDGAWRVDLVEMAKSYAPPVANGLDVAANTKNPYARLAAPPKRTWSFDLGEEDLLAEPVEVAIARLRNAQDPASQKRLAEILLRTCWLVDEALAVYERVARAEGASFDETERFARLAWAVGQPDRAVPLSERWEPESAGLLADLHARAGRFEISQKYRWQEMERRFPGFRSRAEQAMNPASSAP
jgi:hypothetical protein